MWAYSGENFNFKNCVFETSKGAVNAYKSQTNQTTNLTFEQCNFKLVNATSSKKAIIQVGEDNGDTNTFNIVLNKITVEGNFADDADQKNFIGESKFVLNKYSKSANHLNVILDGVKLF